MSPLRHFFERDETQPGKVTLYIGVFSYVIVFAISAIAEDTSFCRACFHLLGRLLDAQAMILAFAIPFALLLVLTLIPIALAIPIINFCLKILNVDERIPYLPLRELVWFIIRNWRGVFGTFLLVTVIAGIGQAIIASGR